MYPILTVPHTFYSIRNSVFIIAVLLLFVTPTLATGQLLKHTPPKLVVGIVIDGMREDYLERFNDRLGNYGIKRFMKYGVHFKNAYIPNFSSDKSARNTTIFTGVSPTLHGIVGDQWFDRKEEKIVEAIEDKQYPMYGATVFGNAAPSALETLTLGGFMQLTSQNQAKIASVGFHPEEVVFSTGLNGNIALWLDEKTGCFISSSYYKWAGWIDSFNLLKKTDKIIASKWELLDKPTEYVSTDVDSITNEKGFWGQYSQFPYRINFLSDKTPHKYTIVKALPHGNKLLTELATQIITEEKMGMGNHSDLLTIHYSMLDFGQQYFTPFSIEVEDIFVRLDKEIEQLIYDIQKKIGSEHVLFFLTSTSSMPYSSSTLKKYKLTTGKLHIPTVKLLLNAYLHKLYPNLPIVEEIFNQQVYLNRKLINQQKIDYTILTRQIATFLIQFEGIAEAYSANQLYKTSVSGDNFSRMKYDLHEQRSGDVLFQIRQGWSIKREGMATAYQLPGNHVPLMFLGNNLLRNTVYERVSLESITPTILERLGISIPSYMSSPPLSPWFNSK